MFSVEDFERDRDRLEFSNCYKNIDNVGESSALIKLKNKTIKKDREYKVTIKNEIKDDDNLVIGVCDSENWGKDILYYYNIYDNDNEIKQLNEKLKLNDSLVIKDTCVAKLNNNKNVYFVSMFKNGDEIFRSSYSDKNRKTLKIQIRPQVEVEVDVKGKTLTRN